MSPHDLTKIGLTDGEARVYVALLQIGSTTVGPICKRAKVSYSKIYEVLQRLIHKGLVSITIKEKTKYFQALEPVRLEEIIEKREQELSVQRERLREMIPTLQALASEKKVQEAATFIGEKGIMTAYDILLNNSSRGSTLRFFYVHGSYDAKVYDFCYGRVNYNNKRIVPVLKQKNMKWLGIINTQKAKKKFTNPVHPIIQRYTNLPLPGNIDITNQAILFTLWESDQPLGILIRSQEIALNFIEYFDSIWGLAKERY